MRSGSFRSRCLSAGKSSGPRSSARCTRSRELQLKKEPSISETLDWARALVILGIDDLTHDVAMETLNFILKYEKDIELAKKNAKNIFLH